MLQCLSLKSSASTSTTTVPVENSREDTPRSISQTSPTVNLTREYTLAVQTNSYNEIWSKIHVRHQDDYTNTDPDQDTDGEREEDVQQLRLAHVLRPDRECVQDALRHARSNTLTRLVSDYFDHSENTSQLCLLLHRSVHHAHSLYSPLHDLLDILPLDSDSLTQSQCNQAFDVFLQFDSLDNPFPCPDSHNFRDMRRCFSQLKEQLDGHIRKSRSKIRLICRATAGSAFCFIGTAVGVAISAVAIATHTLVALIAPLSTVFLPPRLSKKELAHGAQLDAAARGTYVLCHDLGTIDSLVAWLHTAVEGDKRLIRLGLEGGRDKHTIQEVAKHLCKNHLYFLHQLKDLEEHICLCFTTVNRARSLLLREIDLHQSSNS
ncbi:hypothetical protein VitviT2T_026834 [Vitis vinifera]|uniref:Uncharacterized protein n=2 Tax=Vitis vinifera TaxID=29760 RepID=A0ABY9DND8_VITVI|eukprot:XP_002274305.1 PREDICTED: UPF0496 protein At3g19330 isoform X2 [Vitis vinifera]